MKSGLKFLSVLLSGTVLVGCAANPTKHVRYDHSLADRAHEINEAYNQELNGQILINILRARDRQPRFYTSMSDLGVTPSSSRTDGLSIGPIKLGNYVEPEGDAASLFNPWSSLTPSSSSVNNSSLSLTVSPKATQGDDKKAIYHTPVSFNTFLSYYNDWSPKIVDNVMVNRKTQLKFTASERSKISKSLTGKSAFTVFKDGDSVYYCIDSDNCKHAENENGSINYPFDEVTTTHSMKIDNGVFTADPSEAKSSHKKVTKPKGYYTLKAAHEHKRTIKPTPLQRRNPTIGSKITLENGRVFVCIRGKQPVLTTTKFSPNSKSDFKSMEKFDCSIKSSLDAKEESRSSLIFVAENPESNKQGNVSEGYDSGIYSLSLNSIDNMIFRVGSSLRPYRKSFDANTQSTAIQACKNSSRPCDEKIDYWSSIFGSADDTFFKVSDMSKLRKLHDRCLNKHAAVVKHQGKTYLSGPPERQNHINSLCHRNDDSGSVLTLIAEIIKLNEVNANVQPSNILFSR